MSDYIDTTFEFEGNTFPLRILTGVVIDTETRSDTHVSSRVDNLAVSSYVKVTKDIWLRSVSTYDSGEEIYAQSNRRGWSSIIPSKI